MDDLAKRGSAMESAFFQKRDQELLEKMRKELAADEGRSALAAVSGISDSAALDALLAVGISPESLTSVSLIPLVAVAWSDGAVQDGERKAILEAAEGAGIASGSNGFQLLEAWLSEKPGDDLLASWKDYIGAVKSSLDEVSFGQLKTSVLGRAQSVAESAGGFLGLGNKVSDSEQAVIDELTAAF